MTFSYLVQYTMTCSLQQSMISQDANLCQSHDFDFKESQKTIIVTQLDKKGLIYSPSNFDHNFKLCGYDIQVIFFLLMQNFMEISFTEA